MNKKISIIITTIAIFGVFSTVFVASTHFALPQQSQDELDLTVSGKNECLRYLTRTVQTAYVPFRTGANEQWQVTIECVETPGAGGWTDVYLYNGYWNEGTNYKCLSEDLYPIIDKIESTEFRIQSNNTFTQTFGESTPQSYTLFFLLPVGGQGTYQIKVNQLN